MQIIQCVAAPISVRTPRLTTQAAACRQKPKPETNTVEKWGGLPQGCSVLRTLRGRWGFPAARMCESIGDNPNRRLSHVGVAIGDFAFDPGPPARRGQAFRSGGLLLYAILGMVAGANSYWQIHEF